MKTTTLLTMTALSALFLTTGTITTPAEAAIKVKTVQVKPKINIKVRPRIRVRPRVRVNVNTQRLITRDTNIRETPPTNDANLPRQQTPPSRTANPPRQPAPTNTAATPGTSEDPSSNGLTTPSNAPQQTSPTKTVNPDTVPLPRNKPSRITELDIAKFERLREIYEASGFFLTLRELENLKSVNLFGGEDGSLPGDHDGGTVLAGLPDGVTPATPNITTEGAPDHAALINSDSAGNYTAPPNDGGGERRRGGTRPGPRGNPSPHTKVDFSGRNGQASDGNLPNETDLASDPDGENDTIPLDSGDHEGTPPGGATYTSTYNTVDGNVTYFYYYDGNGTEFDREAIRETNEGEYKVKINYEWNSETRQYNPTSIVFSAPNSQPVPHDGAIDNRDVVALCRGIPMAFCTRGLNSTSTPEEMTSQPAEGDSGGHRTAARLGQEAVTNPGDGSFDTGRTTLPRAATAQDEGIVNPSNPDPDCIACGING